MSKQRPDPEKIANELAGGSSFFKQRRQPTQPVAPAPQVPSLPQSPSAPEQQTNTRTPDRTVRPQRRQMIRHAFEVYMDQLETLRARAAGQRERGELGSMSKMVRDAIDHFLDTQSPEPE